MQTLFLSITFAFCIYFLLIKNATTSVIVFACVAFVVNGTLFAGSLHGWEIGKVEMVAVSVLLGLSIDYSALMGVEYVESKREYRKEKLAQTYKHIGITILYAWFAMFGVGLIQLGCQLPLGLHFVYVLSLASTLSMLASLLLFGALSHIIGFQKLPGDHWCHLVNLVR